MSLESDPRSGHAVAAPDLTAAAPTPDAPAVGRFERLPKWLNLVPMVLQWLWLGLRYRSLTLPASANPAITAGGLVGEGKLEYFAIMGALARAATAEHVGVAIGPETCAADLVAAMTRAGLDFPIVVKPDLGWCGYGVCRIDDVDALARYLAGYPRGQTLVLQRYLAEEGEAGLFYARHRDDPKGALIGILLRGYPAVTGNGRDSVGALMAGDARLRRACGSALRIRSGGRSRRLRAGRG